MTDITLHQENAPVQIDQEKILQALKLNPRDANTQALLLVCQRYELDPLLKHMVLISGNPYVTRDGYLSIAHRSGVFDGMEVIKTGEDQTHYLATVAVYRKDMSRPFVYQGRFPKAKQMAKDYGPEMAVKVAEVQALRRAFNVTGVGAADERWETDAEVIEVSVPAEPETLDALRERIRELSLDDREALKLEWIAQNLVPLDRLPADQVEQASELITRYESEAATAEHTADAEVSGTDESRSDADDAVKVDEPAVVVEEDTTPAPKPQPVGAEKMSPAQKSKLFAILAEQKVDMQDRGARLAWVGSLLDRDIDSFNDISKSEARTLIDTIESMAVAS